MLALEAQTIKKIYGGKFGNLSTMALNGVDLKVHTGEFVGIMGPSGSGKSTLLNILGGIMLPSSGEVLIDGKNIYKMKRNELALFRRNNIGIIFQKFDLLNSLTVKENIMLPMILDKQNCNEIDMKSEKLMNTFDIRKIQNNYPYSISGGQQQKVAACRALINNPVVVLADEPTGNLDSKSSIELMEYFSKINRENKSTIIMVTHDPFAACFCDRIIFIKDGKIHMELNKKGDKRSFLTKILDCQAIIGGKMI